MLQWVAHYSDDTSLTQFDDMRPDPEGRGRSYEQIDKSKLEKFEVYDDQKNLVLTMDIPRGAKFIFRKKRRGRLTVGFSDAQITDIRTTPYSKEYVVFFIGLQEKLSCKRCIDMQARITDGRVLDCTHFDGRYNSFILAIHPDGHIEAKRNFDTKHEFMKMAKKDFLAGEEWDWQDLE